MDCSINESAIVPTINAMSIYGNQPTFYLTTPIRNLLDCSNDQSIPITKINEDSDDTEKENNSTELTHWYKNLFHQLWRSTLMNNH